MRRRHVIPLVIFLSCLPLVGSREWGCADCRAGESVRDTEKSSSPIVLEHATRVADPKLAGSAVTIRFRACSGRRFAVVELLRERSLVCTVWRGQVDRCGTTVRWNGKDGSGKYVDTGEYTIRIRDPKSCLPDAKSRLNIVRLGITEIAALESDDGDDEWQMVYFMKGSEYEYFATPAIHEYLNRKTAGDVSDLDLNNGKPRPSVGVHAATDSAVLNGANYEADAYNYPVSYLIGAQSRLDVSFGESGTSCAGSEMPAGYPIPGVEIRVQLRAGGTTLSSSAPIAAGGHTTLYGPRMPAEVTRMDYDLQCQWQYRVAGNRTWCSISGSTKIPRRVYTLIGAPQAKEGASGAQYAGPWVEVAEYWHQWQTKLGASLVDEVACVKNHVRGFFGQNAGIPTAIEGLIYDAKPLGGTGGRDHYYNVTTRNMDLAALLNKGDNSQFFNCSDNMGATATMLSMMGVRNVRAVKMVSADPDIATVIRLNAVRAIGAPGYTTDLWGRGRSRHSFRFHRVVTIDDGTHLIDTCLQVDEDGVPHSTPGIPGWNHGRPFSGSTGYDNLSSSNLIKLGVHALPGIQ